MSCASLPDFLSQGEVSRLFPILSNTSKEGRTASITLACISRIDELGRALLSSAGNRVGVRARIDTYSEIVPVNLKGDMRDRPDGLIVLRIGPREWKAFVEAKIGGSRIETDQIERYRALAKANGVDCVITISNQFATSPTSHPVEGIRNSRSTIPVVHWSWMFILTTAELLYQQDRITDDSQKVLLNEFRRFLAHESAGVRGFTRMPKEWTLLNRLISTGGEIDMGSNDAVEVVSAWHQETRDLSLILTRLTETPVTVKIGRTQRDRPSQRIKEDLLLLQREKQLRTSFSIPDAAGTVDVIADLARRCVDVGMTLRAPQNKKSTSARLNWLIRQIKSSDFSDLYVRIHWPGKNVATQYLAQDLMEDVSLANPDNKHLAPSRFNLFISKRLGGKFIQQSKFIDELENLVPAYYRQFGSKLVAWKKPAPTLREDVTDTEDVSTGAISVDADADALGPVDSERQGTLALTSQ
ncbi:MAG: hypothetical protein OXC91_03530 [Rhodobacteraceae bacterium]|nr:hypothetical protein [Paracoccaceae bacterium]